MMLPHLVLDNNGVHVISQEDSKASKLSQVSPMKSILAYDERNFLDQSSRTPSTTQNENTITSVYKPVVYVCRWLGICPVKVTETNDREISYSFKFLSRTTFGYGTLSTLVVGFYLWWLAGVKARPWHYLSKDNEYVNRIHYC